MCSSDLSAEDAVVAASINAASVISHLDTQTGLLKRKELEARRVAIAKSLKVTHWDR